MPVKRHETLIRSGQQVLDLEPRDYYALKLAEVRADIRDYRKSGKATAVTSLPRLELDLVERAPAREVDPVDMMTDGELLKTITNAVVQLPPSLRDSLRDTLDGRASGQVVKMAVSGKK